MPAERTRNVLQAGAFLRELAASKAVPKSIREEAYRLLRHYPTVSDIEAIALHEERLRELTQSAFVRPYLGFSRDTCKNAPQNQNSLSNPVT